MVVFPASGCDIIAKFLLLSISYFKFDFSGTTGTGIPGIGGALWSNDAIARLVCGKFLLIKVCFVQTSEETK